MVSQLLHSLLRLHGWEAYLIVAVLCFGEAALFLGFVIPGETAVVIGGVLASQHRVNLATMIVVVVLAAIVGDTCGYEVGRHFGGFALRHRPLRGHPGVDRTREFIKRRGGPSVFLGRFAALLRALVPGVAGMSGMRYRTFIVYNALGGLIWGAGVCIGGYELGNSYEKLIHAAGVVGYVIVGVLALVVLVLVVAYRRRRRRHPIAVAAEPDASVDDRPLEPDDRGLRSG